VNEWFKVQRSKFIVEEEVEVEEEECRPDLEDVHSVSEREKRKNGDRIYMINMIFQKMSRRSFRRISIHFSSSY